MSILNSFEGSANRISNLVNNPFERSVTPIIEGPDFPEGFKINELLPDGRNGDKVVLAGSWMPIIPFTFGGSQRFKKEFYSGYSEPTMQIFGPEEDDITINGLFKEKRYSVNSGLKNISTEIQQQIDAIRIRGNIVRLQLGEFERYAIISKTKFDMQRLSRVGYEITFSVIGFNAPKNARFLQRRKEIPFGISKELIDLATSFNLNSRIIPDTIPRSIADEINALTNDISESINNVTNFVDQIFSTVQDIKSAVNRVNGLIKFSQQRLNAYKRQVGAITSFDPTVSLVGRYDNAKYSSSSIASASGLTALLERLRRQFSGIVNDLPLARNLVIEGDTLQKIAVKFYGNSNDWKKIYDYNNLSSTQLQAGTLLQIPRL